MTNKNDVFKNSNVLEVGISDHHSFIITALKSQPVKENAETKLYRGYSEFNMGNFKVELDDKLKSGIVTEYSNVQNIFIQVRNNHVPANKKIMRFNNSPFMTKTLRKAIMHRSRLKNIYIRKRNDKNWENYKKQRNFCVDLLCQTKTEYFKNLNVKYLSDNRKFWKTIKLYFSNKVLNLNKLLLKEKGNFVSDEKELATIMNSFFINITKDLELKKDSKGKLDNLEDLLKAFESQLSIEKIKKSYQYY